VKNQGLDGPERQSLTRTEGGKAAVVHFV